MAKTSVDIPDPMIDDIDTIGIEREMTRSQVIRKAIKEFIKRCKKAGEIK